MDFKPIFRMMVCSDIHFGESDKNPDKYTDCETEKQCFERCVSFAYSYGRLDAFVAVGDFVTSGCESEMQAFKASLDKCIRPETKILLAMASHEYFAEGVDAANEKLLRIFGKQPCEHITLNGFDLIAASTDDRCQTGVQKQNWISDAFKKATARDPEKPIFFFFHPQFQNTVYGSAVLWRTSAIMRTVMNYPKTVAFGGHSHAPVNDPRNLHQKHFTCVGTGSIVGLSCCNADRQPFSKQAGTAQFLIVEADEGGRVRIIAVDGSCGKPIREWTIENITDPSQFVYTDARYASAKPPVFPKDAVLSADAEGGKLKVCVTQAKDGDERVPGYNFTVKNKDGLVIRRFGLDSGYYRYEQPDTAGGTVDFDFDSGEYILECRAESFYDVQSEKLCASFINKK